MPKPIIESTIRCFLARFLLECPADLGNLDSWVCAQTPASLGVQRSLGRVHLSSVPCNTHPKNLTISDERWTWESDAR
jgi:hypothetical protein